MSMGSMTPGFEHGAGFVAGEVSGGLGLGPLETHYEELSAEALVHGVIVHEESARLENAADNLGLDPQRLLRLEQAMVAPYQACRAGFVLSNDITTALAALAPEQGSDGDLGKDLPGLAASERDRKLRRPLGIAIEQA